MKQQKDSKNTKNPMIAANVRESKVFKLVDREGWDRWNEDNPRPSEEEMLNAMEMFFELQPDMTHEDFYAGRDPNSGDNI